MNVIKRYHYIYFCVSVTSCVYVMKIMSCFRKLQTAADCYKAEAQTKPSRSP